MDAASAALVTGGIAQSIVALVNLYATHTNKPEGWKPTEADWAEIDAWANKTPDDIKREAAERLGVPWPPVEETPQAPV